VKILHFQVPMDENLGFTITPDTLQKFLTLVKEKVGNEFCVMATPCHATLLSTEKDEVYNFDMKQISFEELKTLVEK
jgi:hypothetical protein